MNQKEATKRDLNRSGITPTGNHILVKPDVIEEFTSGTHGSPILLPEKELEKYQASVAYGQLIAVGADYCLHMVEKIERWTGKEYRLIEKKTNQYAERFAEPGDRISFAIHSGRNYAGEDGENYLVMNDKDITARVTDRVTATHLEARKPFGDS